MGAPALLLSDRYEQETLELARTILQDIPACCDAHYRVRFAGLVPLLVLAFDLPETIHQPAVGVRLSSIRRSDPLGPGNILEGDRLRRHIRDSVEQYLLKHGVRIPTFEGVN